MESLFNNISEIFLYLKEYKSRTFMTMFGIIWGTITIIVLLSFGVGVKKSMSKNMHGIGESIILVWPGRTAMPFKGYGTGRYIPITAEDVLLLKNEIPEMSLASPEFSRWDTYIRLKDKKQSVNLTGIIPEYGEMRNIFPESGGRWINKLDLQDRRRVVFLGNKLKEFLFGKNVNAVGKYVFVGDTPFRVIGVLKKKTQNSSYNSRDEDRAFIPSSTFTAMFGEKYVSNFVFKVNRPKDSEITQKKVYQILGKKYKFNPDDKEALSIWDTTEMDKFVGSFSLGMNIFLGIIGVITLIVGGIGLANIMYVVVEERIKEIGIKRSIGARKIVILRQFIFESFLIIGIGALIGLVISLIIIKLVSMLPIQEYVGTPEFSPTVAVISIVVLSAIGFTAGYFPARRAANLNVVDCIRY